jgi:hypothetical protein
MPPVLTVVWWTDVHAKVVAFFVRHLFDEVVKKGKS